MRWHPAALAAVVLATAPGADAGHAGAGWKAVASGSRLTFVARQAGAPMAGTFREFEASICLDPAAPQTSHISVRVHTDSVETGLPELDQALRGREFFDSRRWPDATFESEALESRDRGRYRVRGRFTLRGVTREITVPFTFTTQGDGAVVEGRTGLDRLDYGVGQGEWADTRWVGNEVALEFSVRLEGTELDCQQH